MPGFPEYRGRRMRRTSALRNLVRETTLSSAQLVLPLFVRKGNTLRRAIESMPGVCQTSPDELLRDCESAAAAGVGGVILFGIPDTKDATGTEAWADDGAVQQAVRLLKGELPELVVITDVCMCEYTEHGHCGVLEDGEVLNDATLELLSRASVSHAAAGADIIAPSDMMDGRVAAIRSALDSNGFSSTPIMSYAAK
ncbi:MAG TPA: porphobilinogen synthase, partial [Gemmatimonadaceae bacterium]|nr:porphobilinogen synthase [Gemmatimonadaceae bacterium]